VAGSLANAARRGAADLARLQDMVQLPHRLRQLRAAHNLTLPQRNTHTPIKKIESCEGEEIKRARKERGHASSLSS
jgi:hypothetical protein